MTIYSYRIVDALFNGKMRYSIHNVKSDENGDTVIEFGHWMDSYDEAVAIKELLEGARELE